MRFSPETVYDVTNLVALAVVGSGVWLAFGLGYALISIGVAALALNVFGRA